MESEDLAWLRPGEVEGHSHGPGAWPFGIDVCCLARGEPTDRMALERVLR